MMYQARCYISRCEAGAADHPRNMAAAQMKMR